MQPWLVSLTSTGDGGCKLRTADRLTALRNTQT